MSIQKPLSTHWADVTAFKIIKTYKDKETYTVASGITPSGVVHIGNFREVITVDLVARALKDLGKSVRFIYSWDDFDTFRKVPLNLPNQEELHKHLRKPISVVPDPYGECASYAQKNEKVFEKELNILGINPEFLYQYQRYSSGLYAAEIIKALQNKEKIKAILNKYRTEPLEDDWLPTSIYCEQCFKDEMEYERYDGDRCYSYKCKSCGYQNSVDIFQAKTLKLNWRTDWPMRWYYENVDFEPGGKDHSVKGGSYDTGRQIVEALWNRQAPMYLQYDFVSIKGYKGKMSSSLGNLISLSEALEIYSPQIIRYIFAAQQPNHDFSLSFDIDVIRIYDEFDALEKQIILSSAPNKSSKWEVLRRIYQFSTLDHIIPQHIPYRPPFRELCGRLQIYDGDIYKTMHRFYSSNIKTEQDEAAFVDRSKCALIWLEKYALEDFKYRINKAPINIECSQVQQEALLQLKKLIQNIDVNSICPSDLNQLIYEEIIHSYDLEPKEFFALVYKKLINREQGPRLANFIIELGKERVLSLLE